MSDFGISCSDLMNHIPPSDPWLVDHIIPKRQVGVFVATAGSFKTMVGLDLAISVASGNRFLDKEIFNHKVFEKGSAPVCWLDAENGINSLHNRVKRICKGREIDPSKLNIQFSINEGLKLDCPESNKFESFRKYIDNINPELLIVDGIQRFLSCDIDQDNQAISDLFVNILNPLAEENEMTILLIHHLRKGGNGKYSASDPLDLIRGASEIRNTSRFILGLQKKDVGKDAPIQSAILSNPKCNDFSEFEDKSINIEFSEDEIIVSYAGEPEKVFEKGFEAGNMILKWCKDRNKIEFRMKDVIEGLSSSGFYQKTALNDGKTFLLKSNKIKKIRHGVYEIFMSLPDSIEVHDKGFVKIAGGVNGACSVCGVDSFLEFRRGESRFCRRCKEGEEAVESLPKP